MFLYKIEVVGEVTVYQAISLVGLGGWSITLG